MTLSILFQKKFLNKVEQILHSPCNTSKRMLEMTMIIDAHISKEKVREIVPVLLRILKSHNEAFKNVRFNMVWWNSDQSIETVVMPMSVAMLESTYEPYQVCNEKKEISFLLEKLKLFHARSKFILLLTDGMYERKDDEEIRKLLQPFLYRKILEVMVGETIEIGCI